jgi:hypothetical protein
MFVTGVAEGGGGVSLMVWWTGGAVAGAPTPSPGPQAPQPYVVWTQPSAAFGARISAVWALALGPVDEGFVVVAPISVTYLVGHPVNGTWTWCV